MMADAPSARNRRRAIHEERFEMVMSFSLRLNCPDRKPMQEIGVENVSTGYSRNDTRDKRVGASLCMSPVPLALGLMLQEEG
jgi:hypothetical protein